jgi:nucleoside-triphosphatase THEP1
MPTDPPLPIAAVRYSPGDPIDTLMRKAIRVFIERGARLGGVLQDDACAQGDEPCQMRLEDLATGEHFALSQELGKGSEACRLDPAMLAHAAVAIRKAIDEGAELIIVNKFGAQEAAGSGLRQEMGCAVLAGVPLLTTVADRFVDDWLAFTGGSSELIEPSMENILNWWEGTRAAR